MHLYIYPERTLSIPDRCRDHGPLLLHRWLAMRYQWQHSNSFLPFVVAIQHAYIYIYTCIQTNLYIDCTITDRCQGHGPLRVLRQGLKEWGYQWQHSIFCLYVENTQHIYTYINIYIHTHLYIDCTITDRCRDHRPLVLLLAAMGPKYRRYQWQHSQTCIFCIYIY